MTLNREDMSKQGPGKSHRTGITVFELFKMFPDDRTAEKWFDAQDGRAVGTAPIAVL